MSIAKKGISALGKLILLGALAVAFAAGAVVVVYISLSGEVIQVPEIVGKDFVQSEKDLVALGLKLKRRADRFSTEAPNTILEQLPKPGETVKTGQMILVVTSKQNAESGEKPTEIRKNVEEPDDTEKIQEMISDKPKAKPKVSANTAVKKKVEKTRDSVTKNASNTGSDSANTSDDAKSTDAKSTDTKTEDKPKPPTGGTVNKQGVPSSSPPKPSGGDVRPRSTPKPQ